MESSSSSSWQSIDTQLPLFCVCFKSQDSHLWGGDKWGHLGGGCVCLSGIIFIKSSKNIQVTPVPYFPLGWKNFHTVMRSILGLVLPLLVMIVCYSGILKALLRCIATRREEAQGCEAHLCDHDCLLLLGSTTTYRPPAGTFQEFFGLSTCKSSSQLDQAMQVTGTWGWLTAASTPSSQPVGREVQEVSLCVLPKHIAKHLCKRARFLWETGDRVSSTYQSLNRKSQLLYRRARSSPVIFKCDSYLYDNKRQGLLKNRV